jgi:Domain of unknown function (DUF1963)
MPEAHYITAFHEVTEPITELVTKFGGQPVWLEKPCWATWDGVQIPFLCQIQLDTQLFPNTNAKMAYVFFREYEPKIDGWVPDVSASAVVLQPGLYEDEFVEAVTGPTLTKTVHNGTQYIFDTPCEYKIEIALRMDPEYLFPEAREKLNEEQENLYWEQTEGNKIGGSSVIWNEDDFPDQNSRNWDLILQLVSPDALEGVPFNIDFGDGGRGFVFLSKNGRHAAMTYTSS